VDGPGRQDAWGVVVTEALLLIVIFAAGFSAGRYSDRTPRRVSVVRFGRSEATFR
jgi:hypothetical protein